MRTIILFLILVTLQARADSFLSIGGGLRFDSESSGTTTTRSYPYRIGGGHQLTPLFSVGGDLSRYVVNSSAGSVDITDQHHELLLWVRGSVWEAPTWRPFASFILGVQQDTLTTTFQNDSSEDRGKFEWVTGIGIGSHSHFSERFGGGLEARGLYRPWASPRYTGDFIATLSWFF